MGKPKTLLDFFTSPKTKVDSPVSNKKKDESSPSTPKIKKTIESGSLNGSSVSKRGYPADETTPTGKKAKIENGSSCKKRRRLVIASDSEDSADEYKPAKDEEMLSDFELPSDLESEPEEIIPKKKEKTPKISRKSTSKASPKIPSKTPSKASTSDTTQSSNKVENDFNEKTEEKEWLHLTLDWLKDDKIRDKNGRPKSHPEYDIRTLYVPDSFKKNTTPAMKQWWEMKVDRFDTILFFKVGKFYELYHMDAVVGVTELGLVFMKGDFAHSGFPEIAYARFADKLVSKGYKVARVEQTETPQMMEERCKKMGKTTKFDKVVAREICQVTSKGTRTFSCQDGEPMLASNNFLIAVTEQVNQENSIDGSAYGVCFIDTSVGKFHIGQFMDDRHSSRLRTLLSHYPPSEILYEKDTVSKKTLQMIRSNLSHVKQTPLSTSSKFWDPALTMKWIVQKNYLSNQTSDDNLTSLPKVISEMLDEKDRLMETPKKEYELAMKAFSAVVMYLKECLIEDQILTMKLFEQYTPLDNVPVQCEKVNMGKYMVLDGVTLSNLEIFENFSGEKEGTLIHTIDFCSTNFGKRLLRHWLCSPLCKKNSIEDRLNGVEDLEKISHVVDELIPQLRKLPDLERLLSRIHAQGLLRSKDHPDTRAIFYEEEIYSKRKILDFLSTLNGFNSATSIISQLQKFVHEFRSTVLSQSITMQEDGGFFPDMKETLSYFDTAFDHENAKKTGRIIPCNGVDPDYDAAIVEIDDLNEQFDDYLEKQKKKFQCKVVYFGSARNRFQLEIPDHAAGSAGNNYELQSQRKGFKRFYTSTIKDMLSQLVLAEDRRDAALLDIMRRIFEKFDQNYAMWKSAVSCLSVLDVLISLMLYKKSSPVEMCRPEIVEQNVNEKPFMKIINGRHPALLQSFLGDNYIPNSVYLGPVKEHHEEDVNKGGSVLLVTGPNMGGKSTLMRQTGLLAILAQLGSFVPAEKCSFSPINRIFTRLGASDKINAGESTFFVEVSEMSCILQHATKDSLVLVDELGRGTSTFDGTAIACAVVQELATNIRCRTLFSTHYHSLVEDFANYPNVGLGHMACMVEDDDNHPALENITFLYKFMDGICPKSYGFNVAHLAGIPQEVVQRGYQKAKELEQMSKR